MQAGRAMVIMREESDDSEERARFYLESHGYTIQEVQNALSLASEHLGKLPPDAIRALEAQPIWCEIIGYATGGGPEMPERLF
jgi:hypothetical protein